MLALPVSAMFRRVVVVNDDGAADDAQRARERQVAVGEEPPGGPDALLPARDGECAVLAGQVTELALDKSLSVLL